MRSPEEERRRSLKAEKNAYQLHFGEVVVAPETIFRFYKETVIYPWNAIRGVLQNDIKAKYTGKTKKGYGTYISLENMVLYFDNKYRTLREGTYFDAFNKQRHPVNNPKKQQKK